MLITSELTNQRERKALFTCVVYTNNIYFCKCQKVYEKKSKEDEQTLEELNLAHHCSQAKCQLLQTSYIKRIKLLLFLPYNKHLIDQAKSVCMQES